VLDDFAARATSPARRTGLVWHELFMWHGSGPIGPPGSAELVVEPGDFGEESPHPRRRLRNLLEVSGMLDRLTPLAPRAATREQLGAVHGAEYLDRVRAASEAGNGSAGEVTPIQRAGYEFAALAAGGCIVAVDAVLDGAVDNAYALVRPAGHHATRESGGGFCIFNNVAVAVRHAQRAHGVRSIAVIDWDVHHGNGTQDVFWEDPDVLTISIHQADWYPRGIGAMDEIGGGPGRGRNVNVPLPPGSGRGAYEAAFDRVVLPALRRHRPELIVVSCGFDASAIDPSGRMLLTSEGFAMLARMVLQDAEELCAGRLVLCHEGGYSAVYVPFCGLAVLEALSGAKSGVRDPFLARYTGVGHDGLQAHQAEVIDAVAAALDQVRAPG
jgi:acetoin utilization deacetylase AcuC-like enzyme